MYTCDCNFFDTMPLVHTHTQTVTYSRTQTHTCAVRCLDEARYHEKRMQADKYTKAVASMNSVRGDLGVAAAHTLIRVLKT